MTSLGIAGGPAPETRQSIGYTGLLVNALEHSLGATDANNLAGAIAALEACAGAYGRAFAAAVVSPTNARTRPLTPALLASIARRLIRRGESCHVIDVDRGRVALHEASWWDVTGGVRRPWTYRATLTGPSETESRLVSSEGVVHCLYSTSEQQPWRGVSPMGWSPTTTRLVERLERSIADEAGTPTGQLLALPEGHGGDVPDGEPDPLDALRSDLAALHGGLAMLETTAAGWGDKGAAPMADWRPRRLGPDVPASSAELRTGAALSVYAACGVPAPLVVDTDGTAQREAFRRWLHASVQPLGAIVEAELREKLDAPDLALDFSALRASDVASKARAWRSLVGRDATMSDADARRLAGLA